MNVIKQSIGTAMVIMVGACGGGGGGGVAEPAGGGGVTPPPVVLPTLDAAGDATVLQGLSLTGDIVTVQDVTKASSKASWAAARKLDYVTGLDNFDIVGVQAPEIYKDITFVATDMADVYMVMGTNRYVMSNGNVVASVDATTGALTVGMDWSDTDITFFSEPGDPNDITVGGGVTLDISTTSQGAACGGANLFCGGAMDIAKNGTSAMAGIALGNDQYKAGLYGPSKTDVELGGRISYSDPETLTVIGSFVAAQGVPQ